MPIILLENPEIDPTDAYIDPPVSELNDPETLPNNEPDLPLTPTEIPDTLLTLEAETPSDSPPDEKVADAPPTTDKGEDDLTPYPAGGTELI